VSGLTLRVVWPIIDDAMYDAEAIADASFEWPVFAEQHQVTVLDTPRIRVVHLDDQQRQGLNARRAVVCEAPVIKRTATTPHERTAA
jgi:hypothetical protein